MNERLVGIMIAITISIVGFIIKQNKSKKFLDKIDNNPAFREKVINNLDFFYRKMNFDEFPDFLDKIMQIPNNLQLKKYLIIKVIRIDERRILCLTNCTDHDYIPGRFGIKKEVVGTFPINFIIRQNVQKSQYEFYSEIFNSLNEKNLKMDFKDELLKFLST